jgi:hypothetical protein
MRQFVAAGIVLSAAGPSTACRTDCPAHGSFALNLERPRQRFPAGTSGQLGGARTRQRIPKIITVSPIIAVAATAIEALSRIEFLPRLGAGNEGRLSGISHIDAFWSASPRRYLGEPGGESPPGDSTILLQKSARCGLRATIESQRANINLAYRGLISKQCCFLGHPKSFCNKIGQGLNSHQYCRVLLDATDNHAFEEVVLLRR